MTHQDIIAHLCLKYPRKSSMKSVPEKYMQRLSDEWARKPWNCPPEEIRIAIEEVTSALEHHLDEREYIDIGLDSWEGVRNL